MSLLDLRSLEEVSGSGTGYTLTCDVGTYLLVGQDVTLTKVAGSVAYSLTCDSGTYTYTGFSITLRHGVPALGIPKLAKFKVYANSKDFVHTKPITSLGIILKINAVTITPTINIKATTIALSSVVPNSVITSNITPTTLGNSIIFPRNTA